MDDDGGGGVAPVSASPGHGCRARALTLVSGVVLLCACADRELEVFRDAEGSGPSAGTGGISGTGGGSGGGTPMAGAPSGGGGSGGEAPERLVLWVDDFEDGDTRVNPPGGWWYTVNDGVGDQFLRLVSDPAAPERGICLRTNGSGFTRWGAAVGANVLGFYELGEFDTLRFLARAAAPLEVTLALPDGSDHSFNYVLQVDTDWTEYSVRLDQLSVTVDGAVVPLNVAGIHELQWFFFQPEAFEFWLDDVRLLRDDGQAL